MIGLNRRRVMGGKSLPYDAEIEYLESSGTQYINSNYIPSSNTNSYVRYMLTAAVSSDAVFGEDTSWRTNNYTLWARHGFTFGSQDPAGFQSQPNVVYTHELKNKQWFVNGALRYTFTDTFQATYPIYIYGNSRGGNAATERFRGRLYSLKFWEGDVLTRDFIPVRVGQVGYLYDKVSKQLFGNSGTGDFILGADK